MNTQGFANNTTFRTAGGSSASVLVATLFLANFFAGCDSADQPALGAGGVGTGTGGGSGGATGGVAGGGGAGSKSGSGGAGGSGVSDGSGQASLRFCNAVAAAGGSPVSVELQIGTLKLQADSGMCAPGCAMLPAGPVRVIFRMGGSEVFSQDIELEAGQLYGLLSSLDPATQKVALKGGKLAAGLNCATYNPFPPEVKTAGKFCHNLRITMGVPLELDLVVGDVHLKATTQGCSTQRMQMCPLLPSGLVNVSLQSDGREIAARQIMLDPMREYVFGVALAEGVPSITSQALAAGISCATAGPPPPSVPPL